MRAMKRVINFPNKKAQEEVLAKPEEEPVELEIPKRPMFIPKKYAVEWAELCIELMGRKRWSSAMLPLVEAAMVARIVFDETQNLGEKMEAQKALWKCYRLLDLMPKRDAGQVGRPRAQGTVRFPSGNSKPDEFEEEVVNSRWA